MKNMNPLGRRGSVFTGDGPPSAPENEHILPSLLAWLALTDAPETLPRALRERADGHLRLCATCRLGLNLLGEVTREAAVAVGRPRSSRRSHRGPDDAELASYVSYASALGAELADARFPRVKAHLKRCSWCAGVVREELTEALGDVQIESERRENGADKHAQGSGLAIAAEQRSVPTMPGQSGAQWVELRRSDGERTRLLLAPYIIVVGDWTVSISSAAPDALIAVEYAAAPGFRGFRDVQRVADSTDARARDARRATQEKQEQSFTIDLRDDPPTAPWIRVKAHLQAVGTGRLICHLTTTRVTSMADESVRVGGIAWRLERVDKRGERKLLAADTTSPEQVAKASWKQRGDIWLTLRTEGSDWVVPLVIRAADEIAVFPDQTSAFSPDMQGEGDERERQR